MRRKRRAARRRPPSGGPQFNAKTLGGPVIIEIEFIANATVDGVIGSKRGRGLAHFCLLGSDSPLRDVENRRGVCHHA